MIEVVTEVFEMPWKLESAVTEREAGWTRGRSELAQVRLAGILTIIAVNGPRGQGDNIERPCVDQGR